MPACDGYVTLSTKLDNEDLESDLKKLGKTIDKSFDSVEEGFSQASDEALGFADIVRGNVAGQFVVGAVQELGSQIRGIATNFVEAAASVKAEGSQFEQTFGQLQDAADGAIERVAENSGILETRLNTLGSQIYAFARASGGETAESLDLMEKALQAAADGAAYYDRSLEDTTSSLQSFLKGNFENDAALGLSCTETTRNAAAMELFGKKYNDLSEIQKQKTLLQMVMDAQELSGAMGQAAREADGWENVQGNLNEAWRQFSAQVGTPLLENFVPIIKSVSDGLVSMTNSVDWAAFSDTVSGFVSGMIENGPAIISVIAGVGGGFATWNVATMIRGVVSSVHAFQTANDGLKISQIALNAVMNANPLAIVATLVAGLVAAIITLWNTSDEFRTAWGETWSRIGDSTKGVINGMVGFFEGMINSVIRGLNWLIRQANKIQFSIPDWVPSIGGSTWGISIPSLKEIDIPRLATGAVIPPNREFLAVLGDQRSGTNIEAPESLIRKIVREEVGGNNQTLFLMMEILEAIRAGHQIVVDKEGQRVIGQVAQKYLNNQARATGTVVIG